MEPYDVIVNQPVVIDNVSNKWQVSSLTNNNYILGPVILAFVHQRSLLEPYCPWLLLF